MTIEKEKKSHEYWSGRAREYSGLHMDSYGSEKRMKFAEQVAMSIPAGEDLHALDVGCGSGFMTMLLIDAGCKVTGIDFSQDMLDFARENLAGKGYEADFRLMRAQRLDFPDESFDYIVSRNVTWTLEDVDVVYAEIWRVLKKGGVFLNLDANYGAEFNEQDARGVTPTHPTQTLEQLRMRNDIAHDLAITLVDRPQWDIGQFWNLGVSEITCRHVGEGVNVAGSRMFALEVRKGSKGAAEASRFVDALDTPSQVQLADDDAHDRPRTQRDAAAKSKVMLVDYLRVGDFEFDPRKFVVRKAGMPVKMTPKEFNILLTLARNAGKTVSRERLRTAAWGSEFADEAGNLAVHINRIRHKIEDDPANPRYVLTCWGTGYLFDPSGEGGW